MSSVSNAGARNVTNQSVVHYSHIGCRHCHVNFCGVGAKEQETIDVNFCMNIGIRSRFQEKR